MKAAIRCHAFDRALSKFLICMLQLSCYPTLRAFRVRAGVSGWPVSSLLNLNVRRTVDGRNRTIGGGVFWFVSVSYLVVSSSFAVWDSHWSTGVNFGMPIRLSNSSPPAGAESIKARMAIIPRFRLSHLVTILGSISILIYLLTDDAPPTHDSPAGRAAVYAYCPYSTSHKHRPTVILQGDASSDRFTNRTFWVGDKGGDSTFLPMAYPPRDLRLAQHISDKPAIPHKPGRGHLHDSDQDETGQQLCKVHSVPSSPRPVVPANWNHNKVMFGMSTTPDRVLYNIPVWQHWLPSAKSALDPASPASARNLPRVVILTPPPNPTEAARMREARDEAQGLGMNVDLKQRDSDRFETRYFSLTEEMWEEALRREAEEGVRVEWFVYW